MIPDRHVEAVPSKEDDDPSLLPLDATSVLVPLSKSLQDLLLLAPLGWIYLDEGDGAGLTLSLLISEEKHQQNPHISALGDQNTPATVSAPNLENTHALINALPLFIASNMDSSWRVGGWVDRRHVGNASRSWS